MHRKLPAFLFILMASFIASCQADTGNADRMAEWKLPIINGTRITGDAYLSTVGIVQQINPDDYHVLCTGIMISPEYVLTAAHCVANCDDGSEPIETLRPDLRVGIGQNVLTFRYVGEIGEFHVHPDYYCVGDDLRNDIAVLKLTQPVPEGMGKPAYPMSKKLDISAEKVDSEQGVTAVRLGYGRSDANDPLSQGQKYKLENRIYARCPSEGSQSANCGKRYTKSKGLIYFDASEAGTCQGDSGGPVIWNVAGMEVVIGVTSYGYDNCKIVDAAANVSEYEAFISQFVPVLTELPVESEQCDNGKDDDGDGLIDCKDDDCAEASHCMPVPDVESEQCDNGKDDDGDGLIDCKDDDCAEDSHCRPVADDEKEQCDNGRDDDGDGLVDCKDDDCDGDKICSEQKRETQKSGGCSMHSPERNGWLWLFPMLLLLQKRKRLSRGNANKPAGNDN